MDEQACPVASKKRNEQWNMELAAAFIVVTHLSLGTSPAQGPLQHCTCVIGNQGTLFPCSMTMKDCHLRRHASRDPISTVLFPLLCIVLGCHETLSMSNLATDTLERWQQSLWSSSLCPERWPSLWNPPWCNLPLFAHLENENNQLALIRRKLKLSIHSLSYTQLQNPASPKGKLALLLPKGLFDLGHQLLGGPFQDRFLWLCH